MTNYVTQFLPALTPEDWMKVEVGGVYGAITLGDLKSFLNDGSSGGGSGAGDYTIIPLRPEYTSEELQAGVQFNLLLDGETPTETHTWGFRGLTPDQYTASTSNNGNTLVFSTLSELPSGQNFVIQAFDNYGIAVQSFVITVAQAQVDDWFFSPNSDTTTKAQLANGYLGYARFQGSGYNPTFDSVTVGTLSDYSFSTMESGSGQLTIKLLNDALITETQSISFTASGGGTTNTLTLSVTV